MKNEKSGRRYVRRIPVSRLGGGGSARQANTLKLTVRGLRSGRVMLEAADGTAYSCTKERSCGALWGDVVEAQPIGGQRVAVRRVLEHAHTEIVGLLREKEHKRFIIPLERRLPQGIAVASGGAQAQEGDIVRTRVLCWPDEGEMTVRIEERIGSFQQTTHALDALIISSKLRTRFDEVSIHLMLPVSRSLTLSNPTSGIFSSRRS